MENDSQNRHDNQRHLAWSYGLGDIQFQKPENRLISNLQEHPQPRHISKSKDNEISVWFGTSATHGSTLRSNAATTVANTYEDQMFSSEIHESGLLGCLFVFFGGIWSHHLIYNWFLLVCLGMSISTVASGSCWRCWISDEQGSICVWGLGNKQGPGTKNPNPCGIFCGTLNQKKHADSTFLLHHSI